MTAPLESHRYRLENNAICINGPSGNSLKVTFRRTIRVPDNAQTFGLPPDLGKMSLFKVNQYAGNLPAAMAMKGGIFMPMYRKLPS
jgi:hypothetical protein